MSIPGRLDIRPCQMQIICHGRDDEVTSSGNDEEHRTFLQQRGNRRSMKRRVARLIVCERGPKIFQLSGSKGRTLTNGRGREGVEC